MYSTISNATLPNRQSSLLNVTDPRYSATYGNHLLRQVGEHFVLMLWYTTFSQSLPSAYTRCIRSKMDALFLRIFPFQCSNTAPRGGMQYSTFMPSPVAPPQVPNTTVPNMGMGTVPSSGANTGVNNTHYSSTFVSLPMSSRNQVSWPALRGLYFSISLRFSPPTFYIGKFITVSCLGFFLSWVPSI